MAKKYLFFILLVNSLVWLRSSYGKFAGGNFVQNLGSTLTAFSSKNPYPWFKGLLQNVAIPNFQVVGTAILWGELFVALAIIGGVVSRKKWLLIPGLLGGAVLNGLFWLAAGWTSPSTDSLNLLMLMIELGGIFFIWRN